MVSGKSRLLRIPSLNLWVKPVLLAWMIPGAGHWYLKRSLHAGLLFFAVAGMFVFGLLMQGRMFVPVFGGGYIGNLAAGMLYFVAKWLGYNQEQLATAAADYGTKFLVCAGLLNVLAIVDVFEISIGEKS